MDKAFHALKGRNIIDVYENAQGYYLMLKSGTRIELGYNTEVIPPTCVDCRRRLKVTRESPTYLVCDECVKKREEDQRGRAERLRELALKDTPALAALRQEIEIESGRKIVAEIINDGGFPLS